MLFASPKLFDELASTWLTSKKLNQIDVILTSKCRILLNFFLFSKGSIRAFFYFNKIWSNFTWIWSVTTKMLPLFVYVQSFLSFFLFFDVRSILFFKCMKLCNVCYACTCILYWHVVFRKHFNLMFWKIISFIKINFLFVHLFNISFTNFI